MSFYRPTFLKFISYLLFFQAKLWSLLSTSTVVTRAVRDMYWFVIILPRGRVWQWTLRKLYCTMLAIILVQGCLVQFPVDCSTLVCIQLMGQVNRITKNSHSVTIRLTVTTDCLYIPQSNLESSGGSRGWKRVSPGPQTLLHAFLLTYCMQWRNSRGAGGHSAPLMPPRGKINLPTGKNEG